MVPTMSSPSSRSHARRNRILRTLVVLPLLAAALVWAGARGASMLWAERPVREAPPPTVVCWDGSEQVRADCGEPTGQVGLKHVFPSFTPKSRLCSEVTYDRDNGTRPYEWRCTREVNGQRVRITYTERSSLQRGLAFVAKQYRGTDPERVAGGDRLVYRSDKKVKNGRFRLTVAYADHPFTVEVLAPTKRSRDAALDQVVTFRPAAALDIRVQRGNR
ncbi:MAG: hypothetical protein CMH83_22905 [Nocardioides sp.]|nr:hypothetical protein [Nocardioides sp.]